MQMAAAGNRRPSGTLPSLTYYLYVKSLAEMSLLHELHTHFATQQQCFTTAARTAVSLNIYTAYNVHDIHMFTDIVESRVARLHRPRHGGVNQIGFTLRRLRDFICVILHPLRCVVYLLL